MTLSRRKQMMEESSELFQKDIVNHEMVICKDKGVHRHIRFRDPTTFAYWFDLITWEGCLAIQGDMGCFVFSRVDDMFRFFRSGIHREGSTYHPPGSLSINLQYWSEKLIAPKERSSTDVRDFCIDTFKDRVERWVNDCCEGLLLDAEDDNGKEFTSDANLDKIRRFRRDVKESLIEDVADDGHEAHSALSRYSYSGYRYDEEYGPIGPDGVEFSADDAWEWDFYEYEYHYMWCLWAIVWGIRMYDDAKAEMTIWTSISSALARAARSARTACRRGWAKIGRRVSSSRSTAR